QDYRGVAVFAVLKKVPGTTWFVLAKEDAEEVWQPVRRRSLLLGLVATSLILAAAALVFVFWRWEREAFHRARYEAEIEHRALAGHYDLLSRYANDIILLVDEDARVVR